MDKFLYDNIEDIRNSQSLWTRGTDERSRGSWRDTEKLRLQIIIC
ncbi:hypothetical protein LEMLEM_LOCUS13494 [Lemmus lemmus]